MSPSFPHATSHHHANSPSQLVDFFSDPMGMLVAVLEHLFDMLSYLDVDLTKLLDGACALLRLNSVLTFLKPAASVLLKGWFLFSNFIDVEVLAKLFPGKFGKKVMDAVEFQLIFFGQCVPSKNDIAKAATIRRIRGKKASELKDLRYTAADLRLGEFEAKDLWDGHVTYKRDVENPISPTRARSASASGGYTLEELLEARWPSHVGVA